MDTLICNEVTIHKISQKKPFPDWLPKSKQRELIKQDEEVSKRISLIQDFEMPTCCHNIKLTNDEKFIFVSGTYKPRVRCFDVNEQSLRYERCMDSEAKNFEFLSDDGEKMVVLRNDRYLEVQNRGGKFYSFRIPKFGRDMVYSKNNCDLYCVGTSKEVWRFNFNQGRYLSPFITNGSSINACSINPIHHLFVCGTDEGQVEAWDTRCRERVGILDCACDTAAHVSDLDGMPAVTSLAFRDGLTMAVGTSTGQCLVYDIRNSKPTIVKDHNNGFPIKKLAFHESDNVVSMDCQVIKIWNKDDGTMFTYINEPLNISDFCLVPNSGMILVVGDYKSVNAFFIPQLGTAPKWCSFLDSLSQELEETKSTNVYDDYKFLTREELEKLGLTALIGTNMLKGYMHGFFISTKLYHKAKKTALNDD